MSFTSTVLTLFLGFMFLSGIEPAIIKYSFNRLTDCSTRSLGSAAIHMVFVAEGRIDSYLEFGIHCWDIAASGIIVREAGGSLVDPSGELID